MFSWCICVVSASVEGLCELSFCGSVVNFGGGGEVFCGGGGYASLDFLPRLVVGLSLGSA